MSSKFNKILVEKTAVATLTAASVVVALLLAWRLKTLLMLILAAYLLSLVLRAPTAWLRQVTRLPKAGAVAATYVLFLTLLLVSSALVLPFLWRELLELTAILPQHHLTAALQDEITMLNQTMREFEGLFGEFNTAMSSLVALIVGNFRNLFATLLLIVISIRLSLEAEEIYKKIYWLTSNERRVAKFEKFMLTMETELTHWVVVRLLLMTITALATFVGLTILKVPYPVTLGFLAGLLAVIPHIGLVLAAVPSVLLAWLTGGPVTAAVAVVFYMLEYQLDSLLLAPLAAREGANVDALVSIILIVAGWLLAGVPGGLLAIPVYIMVRSFYSWWRQN